MQPSYYTNMVSITPSDSALLSPEPIAFLATGAGTCTVTTTGNQQVQLTLVANTIYPIKIRQVRATGTAATGIFGLS